MKGMDRPVRWRGVLLGTGVGLVTMVTACAAGAGLMAKGVADSELLGYWAAGILVCAGLLGGLTALQGGGTILEAMLTAAGELVVLRALNLGLNGGQVEGLAVTILALGGGSGAAALLGQGRGRKRRKRRKNR